MNENIVLRMESVHKKFPGVKALDEIDFDLREGEIHALVGENGAGKSTLMNILSGVYPYDSGKMILYEKEVSFRDAHEALENGISMIHQELALAPLVSVAENIFIGRLEKSKFGFVNLKRVSAECKALLEKFDIYDIDPNEEVGRLSVSQMQLIEIVKAISRNNKILIMDEPTAALSQVETNKLLERICRMRDEGYSIVYISHRLDEIMKVADRVTVLRDGKLIKTEQINNITVHEIVSLMVGRLFEETFSRESVSTEEAVLEAREIGSCKIHDVTFELKRGEVLGVTGLVGSGRSELLETLFGKYPIEHGDLRVRGEKVKITSPNDAITVGIGLVPEGRKIQGLYLIRTVKENISSVRLQKSNFFVNETGEKESVLDMIARLNVKTPSIDQEVNYLSGGNQQKTIIARWLLNNPDILLLDEPTHGVDVGAKQEIYQIIDTLAREGVSIILVSSELPEILMVCDRVIVMHDYTINCILPKEDLTQEIIMQHASNLEGGASSLS